MSLHLTKQSKLAMIRERGLTVTNRDYICQQKKQVFVAFVYHVILGVSMGLNKSCY